MSYFDDASLVLIPSGYKNQKVYSVKPLDGSGDLTFSRASSATRVASNGLIEKVRTNVALYSENFGDATWVKERISVTTNVTTAPDGTATADKIIENTTNDSHRARQNMSATSGIEYSLSFYAKAAERTKCRIIAGGLNASADFDLSTGTIIGTPTLCTASISNASNGWYRCSITYTQTVTSATQLHLIATLDASGNFIYTGDGTSGIFVWGCQYETGVVTAYIATTTAAVSVGPVSGLPRLDYLNSTCPKLLLEPQRSNLAQYSEQLDNAAWTKNGVTVTANAAVSPDGYTNADKIVETATTGPHGLTPTYSIANSTTYTFSVFAKKAENDYVIMNIYTGVVSTFTSFNVANGTIGTTGAGATAKIENYGNGWYRCMITVTTAATGSPNIFMWTARANDAIEYTGNGVNGTFLYGCVLEAGAYATSYIPTLGTSVTRVAESASSASIPSLFGATEGSFFIECTFDGRNINGAIPLFLRSSVSTSFNQATYLQFGTNNITLNVYSGGSAQVAISSGNIYTTGQTLKISFAYKANDFVMYVNGVQIGTDTSGAISTSLSFVDLGSYLLLQSTFQYDGKISQAILFPTRLSNSDLAALTA